MILFHGIIKPLKKLDISGKKDVLIIFGEGKRWKKRSDNFWEDAVLHLKSEHMEIHQIDALEKVLNILSKIDMTDDDLRTCDRILFEAEMYTIPPMGRIWD